MLKDTIHWMLIVSTLADAFLLFRITRLKLHRLYLFITLDATLGLMFDAAGLWLGWDSPEYTRVYVYSRFLYALLIPAIAWDVFEEVKTQITKARQLGAAKLILALLVTGLFAGLMVINVDSDSPNSAGLGEVLGLLLWGSSCLASLIFLVTTYRALLAQKTAIPRNTRVWFLFYVLTNASSLCDCVLLFSGYHFNQIQSDSLNLLFLIYGVGCTAWCVARLKSAAGETTPAIGST